MNSVVNGDQVGSPVEERVDFHLELVSAEFYQAFGLSCHALTRRFRFATVIVMMKMTAMMNSSNLIRTSSRRYYCH